VAQSTKKHLSQLQAAYMGGSERLWTTGFIDGWRRGDNLSAVWTNTQARVFRLRRPPKPLAISKKGANKHIGGPDLILRYAEHS